MCDCVSAVTQRSRWQIQRLSYRAYSKKSAITTADCIRSLREQNGCCTIVSPVRIQSKVKKMVCPESKRSWSWSLSRLKFVDSAAMVTAAVPACPLVLLYSLCVQKRIFTMIFVFLLTTINLEHQSRVACSISAIKFQKIVEKCF